MRRSLLGGFVAVSLLALSAQTSAAQETGTPIFKAPYRAFSQHEFGASLSDKDLETMIEIMERATQGELTTGSGS